MRLKRVVTVTALCFCFVNIVPASATTREIARDPSIAQFEDGLVDMSLDWGDAAACVIWAEAMPECFRSEADLQARIEAVLASQEGALLANCPSSLQLYDGASYAAPTLYLFARGSWINLNAYGWSNRTSSFKVGVCSSYLADLANGGGDWYPIAATEAGDQAPSMISGWNNRVSSVYIN